VAWRGLSFAACTPAVVCFGYRNVPIEDSERVDEHGRPVILGVRLEVSEQQAAIVRQIFKLYAGGYSLKRLAKTLNAKGVPSPQPQAGRLSRSWCPSSLRVILRNDRYRGLVIWAKTRKIRSADTGRKVYRHRPKSERVMREVPGQRIISDELWEAAALRRDLAQRVYEAADKRAGLLRSSAMNPPYLFSGLLRCKTCGANLQIVAGRGRNHKSATYGCPLNFNRGDSVCPNRTCIRRDVLEKKRLLCGLQEKVLREGVIAYALSRFEAVLERELENIGSEMDQMKKRKVELETEIHRLATGLALGTHSAAVMSEITKREVEISEISNRLLSSKPNSVRSRIAALKEKALSRLHDLREYLNSDPATARAYLAKNIEKIEMDSEGGIYIASGRWNLLGSGYAWMVPGGRVELPTPAFSGPRSTGELPRHRGAQKL
jgi:site-specific DNA recombinase